MFVPKKKGDAAELTPAGAGWSRSVGAKKNKFKRGGGGAAVRFGGSPSQAPVRCRWLRQVIIGGFASMAAPFALLPLIASWLDPMDSKVNAPSRD